MKKKKKKTKESNLEGEREPHLVVSLLKSRQRMRFVKEFWNVAVELVVFLVEESLTHGVASLTSSCRISEIEKTNLEFWEMTSLHRDKFGH